MLIVDQSLARFRQQISRLENAASTFVSFNQRYIEPVESELEQLLDSGQELRDGLELAKGVAILFEADPEGIPESMEYRGKRFFMTDGPGEYITNKLGWPDFYPFFRQNVHDKYVMLEERVIRQRIVLFNRLIKGLFGDDYKAIFLFSAVVPPDFHTLTRSGNWDYIDVQFKDKYTGSYRNRKVRSSTPQNLDEYADSIKNPLAVHGMLDLSRNDDRKFLDELKKRNKTTKFIGWDVGHEPSPNTVVMGEYDIVYLQEDWAMGRIDNGMKVAKDLIKEGGWIVTSPYTATEILQEYPDIKPILRGEEVILPYHILAKSSSK